MTVNVDDWVRSHSAGIWQVVREIPAHFEPRFSVDESKKLYDGPLFIVKRLVNNKWKRSFEIESVHHSLLKSLNKADAKKLATFIANNGALLDSFAKYERSLTHLLNISFALERKSDHKKLRTEISGLLANKLDRGITSDQILRAIAASTFANACGEMPRSATLQFINNDYEVRRRELVFRSMEVLAF